MNPLDHIGEVFRLSMMNPNPSSGRNKAGPWYRVSFEIDEEAYQQFQRARELAGMVIETYMTVAALNEPAPEAKTPVPIADADAQTQEESAPAAPNEIARSLHADGYFRNPGLWDALERMGMYSKDEHIAWIRSLPCLFESRPRQRRIRSIKTAYNMACSGEVCGHHTTAAHLPAAGEGDHPHKVPDWYLVPLCHNHHANWVHGSHSTSATREEKQHLVVMAVRFMAEIAESKIKEWLGIESLNELTEELWGSWLAAIDADG